MSNLQYYRNIMRMTKPLTKDPSQAFRKLRALEAKGLVTIGLNKNTANTIWSKTLLGASMNAVTLILIVATVFAFIKLGVIVGTAILITMFLYTMFVQKIATTLVRSWMLRSGGELLFLDAYHENKLTIRNNKNGDVIQKPIDWTEWLDENFTLHDWAR